jgi:DNA-binding beta-propeller fold protein YncE
VAAFEKLNYRLVPDWEQLPAGYSHRDVVGVGVDSRDRVYLLTRFDPQILVYEPDGRFVMSFAKDVFTPRTHGLTIGPDDSVYCVDDGDHTVRKFSPDGKLLMTIGTPGAASDTGYDGSTVESVTRGGPPFNRPTNVAVAPNGELYVADGYGNARVHRFAADGELIQSWGEPGTDAGQFHTPHGIAVSRDGRVWVTDRENDRIQIFTADGRFLKQWTHVQRPTQVRTERDGRVYVSELWWRVGQKSFTHGITTENRYGRVSVFDYDGHLIGRIAGEGDPAAPGNFAAPHDMCVDSKGDLYVAEVTYTFVGKAGIVPEGTHQFQKFTRA